MSIDTVSIIGWLIALAVGGLLGFGFARWTQRNDDSYQLREKLEQTQNELEKYRQDVTEHFVRSSELMQELARNTRDMYSHFAQSTEQLLNEQDAKVITFKPQETSPSLDEQEASNPPKDYSTAPSGLFNNGR